MIGEGKKVFSIHIIISLGAFGKVYKAINITKNSKYFGLYIAVKEISITKLNQDL